MNRHRTITARRREPHASRAEIHALRDVIAAAAVLAEGARSEAAGLLLRRAQALVAERADLPFDAVERGEASARTETLRPL